MIKVIFLSDVACFGFSLKGFSNKTSDLVEQIVSRDVNDDQIKKFHIITIK